MYIHPKAKIYNYKCKERSARYETADYAVKLGHSPCALKNASAKSSCIAK